MASTAQRQLSLIFSLLITFLIVYQAVSALAFLKDTITPEIYFNRISICLTLVFLPILGGWLSFHIVGGVVFVAVGIALTLFARTVTGSSVFLWFIPEYLLLCFFLYRIEQRYENLIALQTVDQEQKQNQKNDMEVSYKAKGEGISILFEKYSTYYNLRKLAEKLAESISVDELLQMVVDYSLDFIPHGNLSLITLAQDQKGELAVVAHRNSAREGQGAKKFVHEEGDLFDYWVIKNRRQLIVADTHQDFRFDVVEASKKEGLRSLICAPILNEGRVMGTLRVNAAGTNAFNNDDLRLLDTIAVLGSSALSNAMLYEQTEKLAIKDSLTGLYVRRYFFDRLKEEHRRALMTNRPLSVIMCDLDHFKDCNDRYGHAAGDLMLIRFSEILNKYSENAIVARYGGEEFSIILPECPVEQAVAMAETIRKEVEEQVFMIRRQAIKMTVSMGVASFPKDTLELETLLQKSDQCLYRAKREGRNRVCSSES